MNAPPLFTPVWHPCRAVFRDSFTVSFTSHHDFYLSSNTNTLFLLIQFPFASFAFATQSHHLLSALECVLSFLFAIPFICETNKQSNTCSQHKMPCCGRKHRGSSRIMQSEEIVPDCELLLSREKIIPVHQTPHARARQHRGCPRTFNTWPQKFLKNSECQCSPKASDR